jgi:soluble lytic murein transglycosylase-like protein
MIMNTTRKKQSIDGIVYFCILMAFISIFNLHSTMGEFRNELNDLRERIEMEDRYKENLERSIIESARHNITGELALDIIIAADSIGIPIDIAFALVREESSFRTRVVSHVGAIGLTQVMPATGASINPEADLFDPKQNLEVGFSYLRYLMDRYKGDHVTALVAYNVGPTRVDRFGIEPYRRSLEYAHRVMEME